MGSGPYFWMIAVSARAGNGVGGPPGTQDGTRGATHPQAGSRAVTSDTCEAYVPAAEDRMMAAVATETVRVIFRRFLRTIAMPRCDGSGLPAL